MLELLILIMYCCHTHSLSLSYTNIHAYTREFPQINQTLVKVDEVIKEFTNGLKDKEIFDCVNFIIVSDHGELLIVVT